MGKDIYACKNTRTSLERFTYTEKQQTWAVGRLKDSTGDLPCTGSPFVFLNFGLCIHIT